MQANTMNRKYSKADTAHIMACSCLAFIWWEILCLFKSVQSKPFFPFFVCRLLRPRYLDEEQAGALLEALEDEKMQYKSVVLLLLNTGLRRGERCGLEWAEIGFDSALLHVKNGIPCFFMCGNKHRKSAGKSRFLLESGYHIGTPEGT